MKQSMVIDLFFALVPGRKGQLSFRPARGQIAELYEWLSKQRGGVNITLVIQVEPSPVEVCIVRVCGKTWFPFNKTLDGGATKIPLGLAEEGRFEWVHGEAVEVLCRAPAGVTFRQLPQALSLVFAAEENGKSGWKIGGKNLDSPAEEREKIVWRTEAI